MAADPSVDYYELLQVSPTAEPAAILAVYRVLSAKYDPANKSTGNAQRYHLIKTAYETLSNKDKRLAYDRQRKGPASAGPAPAAPSGQVRAAASGASEQAPSQPDPASPAGGAVDRRFEARKRQMILSVLYDRIIASPLQPGLNMRQLETALKIPKEQLEFAMWFLNESGCIKSLDNGRFMITFQGVAECERGEEQLKAKSSEG